jgi:ATP-dependent Clp endopeptidase proteolytic subunit ClpP
MTKPTDNRKVKCPGKKRTSELFLPDIRRLNPDIRGMIESETESHLSQCGILFLEEKSYDDPTGGNAFRYIKKELVRRFNPRNPHDDGESGIGTQESPIWLYINSEGCPINDGMALYDQIMYMRKYMGLHINTVAQGYALSGGALVLQAGNKRMATANSIIMIHGIQSEFAGGTVKQIETEFEAIKRMNSNLVKVWAKNMKVKLKDLEEELSAGDKYFTAPEALAAGLIDEVI